MFVKRHLANGRRAAAIGTRSVTESVSVSHVVSTKLLVLGTQLSVLLPLMLGLSKGFFFFFERRLSKNC